MWSSRAGAPLAAAIETGGMAVGEPAGRRTLRNAWATGQPLAPTLAAAQPLASLASTLSWLGSLAGIDQLERLNNLLDAPFDSPLGDAVATPVIVPLTRFASLGRFASILSTMSFPGLADVMPFGLDHLEDLSAFDHPETGAAIGVAGTLAGVILGVVICWNVESIRQFFSWLSGTTIFDPELYFLSQLPAKMEAGETVAVIIMALVLSFVATLFPAWRASRLDPVDALRYD